MPTFPLLSGPLVGNLLSSVILLLALALLRLLLGRAILNQGKLPLETRRRWVVTLRSIILFLTLLGLVFIWVQELRTFAISVVAIAVAIVVATKELILCLSGAVLRTSSRLFSIGDRIEINGLRGDVVDMNLFTTTLREIGPGKSSHQYTGRSVLLPNSILLSSPVISETSMGDYSVHVIAVPLAAGEDWQQAEQLLLAAARGECEGFLEDARRHMKRLEDERGLDSPTVEPRVTIDIPEPGKITLLLRVPGPSRRRGPLEQAILRKFLLARTTPLPPVT
jgi:small-conductance mechanosensitive channel